jgi:hypothetical protein
LQERRRSRFRVYVDTFSSIVGARSADLVIVIAAGPLGTLFLLSAVLLVGASGHFCGFMAAEMETGK